MATSWRHAVRLSDSCNEGPSISESSFSTIRPAARAAERANWRACVRREASNSAPESIPLVLGFGTCPRQDVRRLLLGSLFKLSSALLQLLIELPLPVHDLRASSLASASFWAASSSCVATFGAMVRQCLTHRLEEHPPQDDRQHQEVDQLKQEGC